MALLVGFDPTATATKWVTVDSLSALISLATSLAVDGPDQSGQQWLNNAVQHGGGAGDAATEGPCAVVGHGDPRTRGRCAVGVRRCGRDVVIAHSDKESAAGTYKRGYGFHPLLAYLRPRRRHRGPPNLNDAPMTAAACECVVVMPAERDVRSRAQSGSGQQSLP
jgi:hypothetical protein